MKRVVIIAADSVTAIPLRIIEGINLRFFPSALRA